MSDTQKKKRIVYSFSLKKNDRKDIKEFIEKQSNFSETLRYLIYKYLTENKNEDISHKLYELLINSNSDSSYKKVTNNNQVINNTPTTSHEDEPEFITNDKSIPYNNSRDTTNYPTNNTMLFDDIPDCYK
ncbi:hypothetical protein [uncultured Clostridium sp.]|uniref:hypothetical protein n=1 Tax=uncultured Clostridium sp. TaxID=59620 RepID=UPI0025D4B25B|nr:hypothetical protein [uncultured Clostridium sp.]